MKKRLARILAASLAAGLLILIAPGAVAAEGGTFGELTWEWNGADGILTVGGEGEMEDVGPESVPWRELRESVRAVVIGDGVTAIGEWAFSRCGSLLSVTIGKGVKTIGEWAFFGCEKLASVEIPDGVTAVEDNAFYDCAGLKKVALGAGVKRIGVAAFSGCDGITSVEYRGTEEEKAAVTIKPSGNAALLDAEWVFVPPAPAGESGENAGGAPPEEPGAFDPAPVIIAALAVLPAIPAALIAVKRKKKESE